MANLNYRYQTGDVLRLCHSNALISAGDYVLLDVGETVTMARLIQSARGQMISRKRVYVQITDTCFFEETGRTFQVQSGEKRAYIPSVKSGFQATAAEA